MNGRDSQPPNSPTDTKLCASPLRPDERGRLETRLDDLLRFLGSPGDWGYGTAMGDLTIYLMNFRAKLQKSEK